MVYQYGEYQDPNDDYSNTSAMRDTTVPNDPNAPTGPVPPQPPAPAPPAPPADPAPPPNPWWTAPTDGNWQAWFRKNLGRDTLTTSELKAMEADLNKAGVQVLTNASGVAGKIRLPTGQIVDVIQGAGSGGNRFQWMTGDGGGSGGDVDLSKISIDPSYLAPWTGTPPSYREPSFTSPGEFESPGDFQAPTGQSILQDPSYQFRVDQGRGAIENAAAARGTLNSGGTLTDILNYGQKAGSQEYSNAWDRAYGLWNTKFQNAKGLWEDKWNNALTSFRANKDVTDTSYNNAWQKYLTARDTWYRNQDQPFNKLLDVARIGAGAAGA